MKLCKKCNVEYEGNKCKPCANLYMKAWCIANPDKVKAIRRNKYEKHKLQILEKSKDWVKNNREKSNGIKKAWKERNREKYLLQQRNYANERYSSNPETIKARKIAEENKEWIKLNNELYKEICREKVRQQRRNYKKENKEYIKKKAYEYIARYPEKKKAVQAVNNAIMYGKMIKPNTCSKCPSDKNIEGHHPDYSKPLDVIWLCRACHNKEHGK